MRFGPELESVTARTRIGQILEPLKREVQAYRSIVDEARACYDADFPSLRNDLSGPLLPIRGAIRIIGRLGSEVYGAIQYPIERRKEGYSPEKILQHSQKEIAGWQEFRKTYNRTP